MENASKALLIAGSVLIVILLIGTGMKIFKSTSGTTESAEHVMDATEVTMFNNQFTQYMGKNKSLATVQSLVSKLKASNAINNHKVKALYYPTEEGSTVSVWTELDSTKTYKIYPSQWDSSGYIVEIKVELEAQ